MKPWKPEYVELLRRNMEELRHVKFIDNRGGNEVSESLSSKENGPISRATADNKVKDVNLRKIKTVKIKKTKNKKTFHVRSFLPEEDAILMSTKITDNAELRNLAKSLNRDFRSVQTRIKKLNETGSSSISNKSFSLEEDFCIIDASIELLKEKRKLADITVNYQDLGSSLGRNPHSAYNRWEKYLKVWLLGYYTKTLNLDIRIMLANVLADNFQDIDSIDWEYVKTFIEFKGHTVRSLRFTFFDSLLRQAAINLEIDKTELSLQQIAENAKICYSKENARKISEPVKIRQMKVIEYFESQAKKFNRKYFL